MKSILAVSGIALAMVAVVIAKEPQASRSTETSAQPVAAAASMPEQSRQGDEAAIRANAEAFAKAYNMGNAKAIASLFVPEGEIVDEEGQVTQGRDAIEQVFAGVFKEHPKSHVKLATSSIRFIGPEMAVEEGVATVTNAADEPTERSPYSVVYSRREGKWLTASSRDLPDEALPAEEQLKQLKWMIGDWVDESPEAMVFTSYRWSDNQCYIVGDFKVQMSGRPVMTGTHRIGWDPSAKKIRSWVFDSEGGFGEGLWTRVGDQWIVKMNGVRRNGELASSTNITTHVRKDRMTWQSRDRIIGGEKTPDIEEIAISRLPPRPK